MSKLFIEASPASCVADVGFELAVMSDMEREPQPKIRHPLSIYTNQIQSPSFLPVPKIVYAFGYSSDDGDEFIGLSPFYVGNLPFVPNGNLPLPPLPQRPLHINPIDYDVRTKKDQENPHSEPERQRPLFQINSDIFEWRKQLSDNEDQNVFIRRRPHQLSIPNQFYQQKEKSTNLNPPNPHDFKTRLNPKAPEFIGVQACKLSFNPDADEFTPFGVDLVGPLSPASTNSSSSFSDIHGQEQCGNEINSDESGCECDSDYDGSAPDEEELHVRIGSDGLSSVLLELHTDEHESRDEGVHSPQPGPNIDESQFNPDADAFIPRYWRPYSPPENVEEVVFHDRLESENIEYSSPTHSEYNYIQSQKEQVLSQEQYQQYIPLQMEFESFITSIPATPFKNGEVIPFQFIDESETIYFPDIDNSILSQVIGSSPTQDGIPVLLTPEVQQFADSLSKLPESLRVVHATEDTPYTRVYGLGGFEFKSDPNCLSPPPLPSIDIESYIMSEELEDKQENYVPSYGFIGFGIDPTLSTPSPYEVSHEETSVEDNLLETGADYELLYGLVGYVPTPAPGHSIVDRLMIEGNEDEMTQSVRMIVSDESLQLYNDFESMQLYNDFESMQPQL
ncbi:unnamed protein product [Orchesella dallaii]|uniref:Uncharacterized protein n=1 Tax=Orchesella dallaii TaxID=48710 RepID=A0ABP1PUM9_9HEXA